MYHHHSSDKVGKAWVHKKVGVRPFSLFLLLSFFSSLFLYFSFSLFHFFSFSFFLFIFFFFFFFFFFSFFLFSFFFCFFLYVSKAKSIDFWSCFKNMYINIQITKRTRQRLLSKSGWTLLLVG